MGFSLFKNKKYLYDVFTFFGLFLFLWICTSCILIRNDNEIYTEYDLNETGYGLSQVEISDFFVNRSQEFSAPPSISAAPFYGFNTSILQSKNTVLSAIHASNAAALKTCVSFSDYYFYGEYSQEILPDIQLSSVPKEIINSSSRKTWTLYDNYQRLHTFTIDKLIINLAGNGKPEEILDILLHMDKSDNAAKAVALFKKNIGLSLSMEYQHTLPRKDALSKSDLQEILHMNMSLSCYQTKKDLYHFRLFFNSSTGFQDNLLYNCIVRNICTMELDSVDVYLTSKELEKTVNAFHKLISGNLFYYPTLIGHLWPDKIPEINGSCSIFDEYEQLDFFSYSKGLLYYLGLEKPDKSRFAELFSAPAESIHTPWRIELENTVFTDAGLGFIDITAAPPRVLQSGNPACFTVSYKLPALHKDHAYMLSINPQGWTGNMNYIPDCKAISDSSNDTVELRQNVFNKDKFNQADPAAPIRVDTWNLIVSEVNSDMEIIKTYEKSFAHTTMWQEDD